VANRPKRLEPVATVKDSQGDYVAFTAPLRFSYTHSTANDINGESTQGKMFSLEYDGFELRVPWEYDETAGEWQPLLNLKDGTEITDGSTTYVVKGVEEGLMIEMYGWTSTTDSRSKTGSVTSSISCSTSVRSWVSQNRAISWVEP